MLETRTVTIRGTDIALHLHDVLRETRAIARAAEAARADLTDTQVRRAADAEMGRHGRAIADLRREMRATADLRRDDYDGGYTGDWTENFGLLPSTEAERYEIARARTLRDHAATGWKACAAARVWLRSVDLDAWEQAILALIDGRHQYRLYRGEIAAAFAAARAAQQGLR